jgi:PadR family transcriptional regulator, regulatory protein PadR
MLGYLSVGCLSTAVKPLPAALGAEVHGTMRAEVLKGHLDAMLLATLADGPRHGYAIKEALRTDSGGAFDLPTGTVYPALHRLERAGLIRGSWSTVNGRRRRNYQLTAAGRRTLDHERSAWREFSAAVTALLGEAPRPAQA